MLSCVKIEPFKNHRLILNYSFQILDSPAQLQIIGDASATIASEGRFALKLSSNIILHIARFSS